MANKKERFWFIDTHTAGEKLAIVEKGTVTVDGVTSNYQTISEAKSIKIRGVFADDDLVVGTLTGSYSNIPSRFHEYIVSKVISFGYKDPRNLNINNADYFTLEYTRGVRKAKKFTRSNYIKTGRIVAQDF